MSTGRRMAWGLGLGLVGFVLNLAALEVLPGVHLLLGPLLVLTAAVLFGPVAGGLAGAVSGERTLWLWGHHAPAGDGRRRGPPALRFRGAAGGRGEPARARWWATSTSSTWSRWCTTWCPTPSSTAPRGASSRWGRGCFERGDRRELTSISGIGVELYVSREIVPRHGGRISLRSREGGGAVATVRLPLGPAPRHEPHGTNSPTPSHA